MSKKHMKRQTAPTTWRLDRKGSKFVTRSRPGKSLRLSMPISLIFKEALKFCKTTKEVKSILQDKEVIIDGKRRKDIRYPCGLMDVISLPVSNEYYRIVLSTKGKLTPVKISNEEAGIKPCKIISKTMLKKGKFQLNFSDGRNLLTEKGNYTQGDVLVLKLPSHDIAEHLKIEAGHYALITEGKLIGKQGTIESIDGNMVKLKNKDGVETLTIKKNIFVIGNKASSIKLAE
ncbi:MAG: 30S ribosomal protein S4e [archaeon]